MAEIEVTVQSFLPYYEPQGQFQLNVSPDTTVEEVLKELCTKAGIPLKPEYILRNSSRATLYRTDTLAVSNVTSGAVLHWDSEGVPKKKQGGNIFYVLAVASFLIGTVGIVAVSVIRFQDMASEEDFAVVFDAGSSHSAMFIYKWEASRLNGTAVAAQFGELCEAEGHGISKLADEPQKAGPSLQPCIDQAIAAIPSSKHSTTPIYLGATAGMRMLNVLNFTASEAILDSVRATFMASPFKVQDPATNVRILSGNEEGTSSWITSNYITNAFKVNQPGQEGVQAYTIVSTLGALDLGGASTQLTYVPDKGTVIPAGFSEELQLFGHNYTVYTHSFLCYGVNEVARALFASLVLDKPGVSPIEHPCLPGDYTIEQTYKEIFDSPCIRNKPGSPNSNYAFVGVGIPSKCDNLVRSVLLNNDTCPYNRCSFNETFQPEIAGSFYAFSSFFWVANFLKVLDNTSNTNRVDFELATTEQCEKNWDELKNLTVPKKVKANLMFYCLQATYISALLTTGYRFSDHMWTGITFLSQIYDTAIGWTLGYVLKESNGYPTKFPVLTLSTLTFALLVALFCLLLIMSLILAIELRRARKAWREHQLSSNRYEAI